MTNQQMIQAIIQSIQTDTNLLILIRVLVSNNIVNVVPADGSLSPQLLAACQALGINSSGS